MKTIVVRNPWRSLFILTSVLVLLVFFFTQRQKGDESISGHVITRHALPVGVETLQKQGIVYNCLTEETISTYDSTALEPILKPIQETASKDESAKHRQDAFQDIYKRQVWDNQNAKWDTVIEHKASGPGSALHNSQAIIAILHTYIMKLKAILKKPRVKILDLPCGDHQYMNHFLKTRDDIDYMGMDIVPELIKKHKERYKNAPHIKFQQLDIANSYLNESFDLIICRMMLQHLSNQDVIRALFHFSESGSGYLAATSFSDVKQNAELNLKMSGRFRPLNLEANPISLEPPICLLRESFVGNPFHYIGIWKLPLRQYNIAAGKG